MRKYIVIFTALVLGLATMPSCDHVDNPFPQGISTDLDTTLYPGNWSEYVANEWPDFSTIPDDNPNRNAIIEDFTGHNCSNCPVAATVAHNLHDANPSRVFTAAVHTGASSSGVTPFQDLTAQYTVDFMNPNGLEFGAFFSTTLSGAGFNGNPAGSVNRSALGSEYFYGTTIWSSKVNEVLSSPRRVQIKAALNYFPSTKGFFLHTEIQKEDASINYDDLGIMVYLIEDSLIAPQNVTGTYTPDYIHRDIMRGTLSGQTWGRDVNNGDFLNDKYYLDYSYVVPNQLAPVGQTGTYNAGNMHVLICVYNKNTYEILQVIKKKIVQ